MTLAPLHPRPAPHLARIGHVGQRRIDMTLPLCLELIDAVRCLDRERIAQLVELIDQPTALVVLAAMVDQDTPVTDLLGWLEEPPPPPDPSKPQPFRLPGITDQARWAHREHARCKNRGLPITDEVRDGEREYHRLRGIQRRATARRTRNTIPDRAQAAS